MHDVRWREGSCWLQASFHRAPNRQLFEKGLATRQTSHEGLDKYGKHRYRSDQERDSFWLCQRMMIKETVKKYVSKSARGFALSKPAIPYWRSAKFGKEFAIVTPEQQT